VFRIGGRLTPDLIGMGRRTPHTPAPWSTATRSCSVLGEDVRRELTIATVGPISYENSTTRARRMAHCALETRMARRRRRRAQAGTEEADHGGGRSHAGSAGGAQRERDHYRGEEWKTTSRRRERRLVREILDTATIAASSRQAARGGCGRVRRDQEARWRWLRRPDQGRPGQQIVAPKFEGKCTAT
jgi:hypothetical protein